MSYWNPSEHDASASQIRSGRGLGVHGLGVHGFLMFAACCLGNSRAAVLTAMDLVPAATQDPEGWGQVSNGLRMRVTPIAPTVDEEQFKIKLQSEFEDSSDVTLAVEIQNVTDEPIDVQGVRYGDTVSPPWPGKSVSSRFAPYLFECEFLDHSGALIERPAREFLATDSMLMVSGGSAEIIAPGESLRILLHPTRWASPYDHFLEPGAYQVRLRYHGTPKEVRSWFSERRKESRLARSWSGNALAEPASFKVKSDPARTPAPRIWGQPSKGLRAAVEFWAPVAGKKKTLRPLGDGQAVPHGTKLDVKIYIQNVTQNEISFWSETWRQDDEVALVDDSGKQKKLEHSWYSGWANMVHWKLKPRQMATLAAINLGVAKDEASKGVFEHPIGAVVVGNPGRYQLRYKLRIGSLQRKDKDGKVIVPGEGDWTGSLVTGVTPILVRDRLTADEPLTFKGRLVFQSDDGKRVGDGSVVVWQQDSGRKVFDGRIQAGRLSLDDCPFETLSLSVRVPGFEESKFYDLKLQPNNVTTVKLTRSEPIRFRLVTRAGGPVAGAQVRYFNRTKTRASVGPYPVQGLQGPIWATSDDDGQVVLNMVQKLDPNDKNLGNNIYFFYIQPRELAPLFVGPVEAGSDLGEVDVGPVLTVEGQLRGTEQELRRFSADWDQPEPMRRGDGTVGFRYGKSQPLPVRREGGKVRFRLRGLRPGKLRIIANFERGAVSKSYEYGLRKPAATDTVFEIDLTNSRNDLILTSAGLGKKPD